MLNDDESAMDASQTRRNSQQATKFICPVCQEEGLQCGRFKTPRGLRRHIFSSHQYSKNFSVTCGIDGCVVIANRLRSLKKHIREAHNGVEWIPGNVFVCQEETEPCNSAGVDDSASQTEHGCGMDPVNIVQVPVAPTPELETTELCQEVVNGGNDIFSDDADTTFYNAEIAKSNAQRRREICLSLARLRSQNYMTEACFENVKNWTTGLLENLVCFLIGGLKNNWAGQYDDIIGELTEFAKGMSNPFHGLSEHNFLKMLHLDLGYVNPETVLLLETTSSSTVKQHTMQYIPILGVIRLLLKDKQFVKQMHVNHSKAGHLKDFCDGDYTRKHALFKQNPNAFQIQLYFDEFEVANPLGSKAGVHKIGALYYTFLNMDPQVRFNFENIHLLALFNVDDLKNPDIGWEKILQRFNEELRLLESGTHKIEDNPITGTVAVLCADNLAAHSILGLDKKFSGENVFVSKFCLCRGSDIQKQFHENECVPRTRENYDADLAKAIDSGRSSRGVKERCPIQSVFFHPIESHSPDAHHDVLEGVVPQTLKPILQAFIKTKHYLTLQTLNTRLLTFDYNRQDFKNRPSSIKESKLNDDSRNLKQYASQYWCLIRKLPLLLGDLVPDGDDHWQLLLCLLGIVDIILSPSVREDVLDYLQTEICAFLREYKRLFPDLTITPKMHYLLHYPRLIKNIGPLSRHWVMRYEGKHKMLKKTMDMTGNFLNSAYTMAKRHQMQQVVNVHDRSADMNTIEVSRGFPVDVNSLEEGVLLKEANITDSVTVTDKERDRCCGLVLTKLILKTLVESQMFLCTRILMRLIKWCLLCSVWRSCALLSIFTHGKLQTSLVNSKSLL